MTGLITLTGEAASPEGAVFSLLDKRPLVRHLVASLSRCRYALWCSGSAIAVPVLVRHTYGIALALPLRRSVFSRDGIGMSKRGKVLARSPYKLFLFLLLAL